MMKTPWCKLRRFLFLPRSNANVLVAFTAASKPLVFDWSQTACRLSQQHPFGMNAPVLTWGLKMTSIEMSNANTIEPQPDQLQLAQICWVIPDIFAAIELFSKDVVLRAFPEPVHIRAQDLNMTHYGKVVPAEWLTTQVYTGNVFIELVQPLSGRSMFHDYLKKHPDGGIQHNAFRLPVNGFERITARFKEQGYEMISAVDHPIARMAFFDTYRTLGTVTEIMGITPEGWQAIEQMENLQ